MNIYSNLFKLYLKRILKVLNLNLVILAFAVCGLSNLIISVNGQNEPICRYRHNIFSKTNYMVLATWGCYNYTTPSIINGEYLLLDNCFGTSLPALEVDGTCYRFLSNESSIRSAVRNSFLNNITYERWLNCVEDAENCCDTYLANVPEREGFCPPVWDGWSCFADYTVNEEDAQVVCPQYAYSGKAPRCHHIASKSCSNGTWNIQTDYATCDKTPRIIRRTYWHIAMLSLSLFVCVPALFILIAYRALRTSKYYMIRNLLLAIILRNTLVLISKNIIVMDELTTAGATIMSLNNTPCKVLTFFEKLAANAVFTCMLLEGIFLHQLLTNVFGTRRNAGPKMLPFYIVGTVVSITAAVTWAILTAKNADMNCWTVTDSTDYHWINDSPRIVMLFINVFLMGHIMIVLWKTFKSKANESRPGLRTARASFICLPLFGIPFVFVIFRPDSDSCGFESFYYFVSYALEGLQGVFVAIFHCYTDKEVKRVVYKTYITIRQHFNYTYGKSTRKSNFGDDRRTTFTTFADSNRLSNRLSRLDSRFSRQNTLNDGNRISQQIFEKEKDNPKPIIDIEPYKSDEPKHFNTIKEVSSVDDSSKPSSEVFETHLTYDKKNDSANTYEHIPSSALNTDGESDDQILDPKILFRNRADGIVLVNDDTDRH